MSIENAIANAGVEKTADERWADWVARGVAQNEKTRKRMTGVAVAIVSGFAIWLATLFLRG